MLAHALDLLLGGRARPGIVRPGAGEAYVEGIFDLPQRVREQLGERLSADAEELVLARRVGADGRTRAYLNGRSASVAELREIGGALLAFYGQHEHRKLTLSAAQLEILDGLCAGEHVARLRACAQAFAQTRQLQERLDSLRELSCQRERELGLLEYELAEIDAVAPEASMSTSSCSARASACAASTRCAQLPARAPKRWRPTLARCPGRPSSWQPPPRSSTRSPASIPRSTLLPSGCTRWSSSPRILPGSCATTARRASAHGLDGALVQLGEDVSLDALEQRLRAIERLARKHGGSVQAVLEYAEHARARHDELAGAEVALAQASEQLSGAHKALAKHVLAVRKARAAAARSFAPAVREQLASLAMGDASFEVILSEREPGPSGGDSVEFMIAPNPGVPAGPLREIASGGELSRVMLAIMSVADASTADAALVFDEVDAGIGGHTARVVGARLRELGERRQVLCITHLPQIASLGARHFSIVKDTSAEPTRTTVVQLAGGRRRQRARAHARRRQRRHRRAAGTRASCAQRGVHGCLLPMVK